MSEVSDITTFQVPNYAKWMREETDPERVGRLCCVSFGISPRRVKSPASKDRNRPLLRRARHSTCMDLGEGAQMREALQISKGNRPHRVGHRPPLTHKIGGVGRWNTPAEYWQRPGPLPRVLARPDG